VPSSIGATCYGPCREPCNAARYAEMFRDRRDAGRRLAPAIAERVTPPAVVLGIPRGGVIVAAVVAAELGWPLGVVVTKKLGAPSNPELGIGAVAPGVRVLEDDVIAAVGVSDPWIVAETARVDGEVTRRAAAFGTASPPIAGGTAVVVDDGVATGATARAAGLYARAHGAARTVLAVPVGPRDTRARVADAFDDVVQLEAPRGFFAVGAWYDTFEQVADEEVRAVLDPEAP
jgi:putative phosphoribosyl transferase